MQFLLQLTTLLLQLQLLEYTSDTTSYEKIIINTIFFHQNAITTGLNNVKLSVIVKLIKCRMDL